jgi:hypothetical protein
MLHYLTVVSLAFIAAVCGLIPLAASAQTKIPASKVTPTGLTAADLQAAIDAGEIPQARTSTNCATESGGAPREFCRDTDDNTLWMCSVTTPSVCNAASWVQVSGAGGGSGDQVSIDGVSATDPDLRSEGDIDVIRCTGAGTPDVGCVSAEDVIFRSLVGGNAAAFDACRRGAPGFGYDPVTDTYAATCGNYPWSQFRGGRSANGAPAYNSPTCSGGCGETITCTQDGRPIKECLFAGQVIHNNKTADLVLAYDMARPTTDCAVYMPAGVYVFRGCGEKANGTDTPCAVPRAPNNVTYVRSVTLDHGFICGEGGDPDGPFEPESAPAATGRETGTSLVVSMGTFSGFLLAGPNLDTDGGSRDGPLMLFGYEAPGGPTQLGSCVPISATDPTCDTDFDPNSHLLAPITGAGGYRLLDADGAGSGTAVHSGGEFCIDNTLASSGTCRGDRRIKCTATGVRTGQTTGGCDFGAGGNLGPCEGGADTIIDEIRTSARADLVALIEMSSANSDESYPDVESFKVPTTFKRSSSFAGCGTGGTEGKLVGLGVTEASLPAWSQPRLDATTAIATRSISISNKRRTWVYGSGFRNVGWRSGSWLGRIVQDPNLDSIDRTATGGSGTTLTVSGSPWTSDQFRGRTVILRPSAIPVSQGCSSGCQELRVISANTSASLTVTPAWGTNPSSGDAFRISAGSCVGGTGDANLATASNLANGCDYNVQLKIPSIGGLGQDFTWWYTSSWDSSGGLGGRLRSFLVSRYIYGVAIDSGATELEDFAFVNNFTAGPILNLSFADGARAERGRFVGNLASSAISFGYGRNTILGDLDFIGNQFSTSAVVVTTDGQATLRDLKCVGNTGGCLMISPLSNPANRASIVIDGVRIYGRGNESSLCGAGPINLCSRDAGSGYEGRIDNISIRNVTHYIDNAGSASAQPCTVWLDSRSTAPWVGDFGRLRLENIFLWNKATLPSGVVNRAVCAASMTPFFTAKFLSSDVGVETLSPAPTLENVGANRSAQHADDPVEIPGYRPEDRIGDDRTVQFALALPRARKLEHLPRFYFSADTTAGCSGDLPQGNDDTGDGSRARPWRSFGRMLPLYTRGAAIAVLDVCDTWETNDAGGAGDNESTNFPLAAGENLEVTDWPFCSDPRSVCFAVIGSDLSGARRARVSSGMLDSTVVAGNGFFESSPSARDGWLHIENIDFVGTGSAGWPGDCTVAADFYRTDSLGQFSMLNVDVEMCAVGSQQNEVWTSHNSATGTENADYFVGVNVGCRYLEVAGADGSGPCHLNAAGSAVALVGGFSDFEQINTSAVSQFALGLAGTNDKHNYGYVNSHRVWFNTTDTASQKYGFSATGGTDETTSNRLFVANSSVANAGTSSTINGFWRAGAGGVTRKNNVYSGYRNVSYNNDQFIDASGGWPTGTEWVFADRCSIHHAGPSGANQLIDQASGTADCATTDLDVRGTRIEESSGVVGVIEGVTYGTITSGSTGLCDDAPSARGCNGGAWTACTLIDLTSDPFSSGGGAAGLCMTSDCNNDCSEGTILERFGLGLYWPSYLLGAEIVGIEHGASVVPVGR